MEEEKEIKIIITFLLRKLLKMDKIGGSHTSIRNVSKGLPLELVSSKKGKKNLQKAVKKLINDGFIQAKISTGELHISINPRKLSEIYRFLGIPPKER